MHTSTQYAHNLASKYALYSFKTYMYGIGDKMLVFRNTCKCFQKHNLYIPDLYIASFHAWFPIRAKLMGFSSLV